MACVLLLDSDIPVDYSRKNFKSHNVGFADAIIAATVEIERATLVTLNIKTLNIKHFPMQHSKQKNARRHKFRRGCQCAGISNDTSTTELNITWIIGRSRAVGSGNKKVFIATRMNTD